LFVLLGRYSPLRRNPKRWMGTSSTERMLAMAEQHLSVHVPNTVALVGTGSDSAQLFLGLTGSVGYLSFLAFVVLRIAGT